MTGLTVSSTTTIRGNAWKAGLNTSVATYDIFVITNVPPSIVGINTNPAITGTQAQLILNVENDDNDPLTYQWSVVSKPNGALTHNLVRLR